MCGCQSCLQGNCGYSSEELSRRSLWDIIPENETQNEKQEVAALSERETSSFFEREIINSDKKAIPVQFAYHTLERAGQRFIGISMQDISDRRASELALAKSEEQLRQSEKMRAVGELTGGVAHDFNNLLAIVLGNAELIEEKLPPDSLIYHI
nr:PAS domain S-box protein [Sneathiella glossodoripedis]